MIKITLQRARFADEVRTIADRANGGAALLGMLRQLRGSASLFPGDRIIVVDDEQPSKQDERRQRAPIPESFADPIDLTAWLAERPNIDNQDSRADLAREYQHVIAQAREIVAHKNPPEDGA